MFVVHVTVHTLAACSAPLRVRRRCRAVLLFLVFVLLLFAVYANLSPSSLIFMIISL